MRKDSTTQYRHVHNNLYGQTGKTRIPSHFITAWGETKTFQEWIEDPRCKPDKISLLYDRIINRNVSPEEAISTPPDTTRSPLIFSLWGETKTIREWSEDLRCLVKYSCLYSRIAIGKWDFETAITTPVGARRKKKKVRRYREIKRKTLFSLWGETKMISEWARDSRCLVTVKTIRRRLRLGWPLIFAITTPPHHSITTELPHPINHWPDTET